jgi:hypothetical protein
MGDLYGTNAYVEQPARKRWSSQSGWLLVRTWVGPKASLSTFLSGTLPSGYSDLDMNDGVATCTVSASYSTTAGSGDPVNADPITRVWTLQGNDVEKHIFEHPSFAGLIWRDPVWPTAIEARVRAYKGQLEMVEKGRQNQGVSLTANYTLSQSRPSELNPPYPNDATLQALAISLTKLMIRNIDTVPQSQYVLRKTETVTNATQLAVSHTYVTRFYTYNSLVATETTLPAAALLGLSGLQSLYWLKKTPTVEYTQQGRFTLAQEYWGAVTFETLIYGAAL